MPVSWTCGLPVRFTCAPRQSEWPTAPHKKSRRLFPLGAMHAHMRFDEVHVVKLEQVLYRLRKPQSR